MTELPLPARCAIVLQLRLLLETEALTRMKAETLTEAEMELMEAEALIEAETK